MGKSKFYGTLESERGKQSTKCGHQEIITQAASWAGAIEVRLYTERDGEERYTVEAIPWHGSGKKSTIAYGSMATLHGTPGQSSEFTDRAKDAGWTSFRDAHNVPCWRDASDGMTWAGTAEELCKEFDL